MPRLAHDEHPATARTPVGAVLTTPREPTGGGGASNGHGPPDGGGRGGRGGDGGGGGGGGPRRVPGPSAKPALIPVGIAALVLIAGGISAALTSSGSAQPAANRAMGTARGATITAVPGRSALRLIVSGGQPPGNILNVVALPRGTSVTKGSAVDNTIGLYDHSLSFTVGVSQERVIDFYRAELPYLKWQIESQGPAPNGVPGFRLVGQHPGDDGYEWEIGVTVAPTTFGSGAAAATETTSFTVRLFAVSDD